VGKEWRLKKCLIDEYLHQQLNIEVSAVRKWRMRPLKKPTLLQSDLADSEE
jgi:hypothetical protein